MTVNKYPTDGTEYRESHNRRCKNCQHTITIGPDGKVIGAFQPSRIRPKFLERLRISGIMLPASMFENITEVQ